MTLAQFKNILQLKYFQNINAGLSKIYPGNFSFISFKILPALQNKLSIFLGSNQFENKPANIRQSIAIKYLFKRKITLIAKLFTTRQQGLIMAKIVMQAFK